MMLYNPMGLNALWQTLILSAIFIANYIHLRWTLKKPWTSWRWIASRLVLAFFMPTLPTAEAILNLFGTIILILRRDTDDATIQASMKDWRRYFCSAAGLYVVDDPETLADDAEEDGGEARPTAVAGNKSVRLVKIQDPHDLRHHKRPWNAQAWLRIVLVLLAVPAAVVVYVNLDEYLPGAQHDRRSPVTLTGIVTCTICALLVLVSRSEWSLVHLTSTAPKKENQYRTFASELALAGLISEFIDATSYWRYYDLYGRTSFIMVLTAIFRGSFFIWLIFVFWAWLYRDEIVRRSNLNWSLLWNTLLAIFSIWVLVDLLSGIMGDLHFYF